jgi:hypothetical protein
VHTDSSLAALLQILKGPVSDLDEAVTKDGFLDFKRFFHFFDVNAFFGGFFFLVGLNAALCCLFGWSALLGVSGSVSLSDIGDDLLLQCHQEKLVQAWVSVRVDQGGIGSLGQCLDGWSFTFLKSEVNRGLLRSLRDKLLLNSMVVIVNYLHGDLELIDLSLEELLSNRGQESQAGLHSATLNDLLAELNRAFLALFNDLPKFI